MPRIDDDRCKFINTKKKKCSRKAPKNKLKIPQINQQTQEDVTISNDLLNAMTLTTSGDSNSEEDIEKALKRAHHNDLERGRRDMEKAAYENFSGALTDATGETPKSRLVLLTKGEEFIRTRRDTENPNLGRNIENIARRNSNFSHQEQILKSNLERACVPIPELPPLPKSPERDQQTREFLNDLNMPTMTHKTPQEADTFDRLKALVFKYTGVTTTCPEEDLLLAEKHMLNPKVKQSKKDKKELRKVINKLKNHLADASNP